MRIERPIHASDITANRFFVIIRDLDAAESSAIADRIASISRDGIPNYFDDQRFGSLGESGEFIAAPWCRGDYERLVAKGVQFTEEPTERFYGIDCGLRDPFGNHIRMTQPAPVPSQPAG